MPNSSVGLFGYRIVRVIGVVGCVGGAWRLQRHFQRQGTPTQ